jgi:hypothetical protein
VRSSSGPPALPVLILIAVVVLLTFAMARLARRVGASA